MKDFERNLTIVLSGPPASGKTWTAKHLIEMFRLECWSVVLYDNDGLEGKEVFVGDSSEPAVII